MTKQLAGNDGVSRTSALPSHFPPWAQSLADLYFSGATSTFVVHGNVFDVVPMTENRNSYGSLVDFISDQLFGRWDVVLHYDLARGIRCVAGSNGKRLAEMVTRMNKVLGDVRALGRDPTRALAALDLFVQKNIMADENDRLSAAIVLDHAGTLVPAGERLGVVEQTNLVTLLNWASSPYIKRTNMAFVLIESRLVEMSARFASNPHVAAMEIPLPDVTERETFLRFVLGDKDPKTVGDYGVPELAQLTSGIGYIDLEVLMKSAIEGGRKLDAPTFRTLKKRLIERAAQGMLEFVEPKWGLDTVVGHEGAKRRLAEDAELIKRGKLDSVPMGYLLCGPVGTGKTFLAQCVAGSMGVPAVVLKNFRSKYVGETEGNLERVLGVLRSMGPVVVVVDEADTMLGDRGDGGGGDDGVSSRIFGMFANQMGDTRYRGRIVWMLLTARPDLLPVDIKRQGRAEVHIPLFYPTEEGELRQMFVVLAKKLGTKLAETDVPSPLPSLGNLSGADIEGILGRAYRISLLADHKEITGAALAQALQGFMPSTETLERELQELAAIVECSDAEFLPPSKKERLAKLGGREKLQERINAIKQILAGT